MPEPLVPPPAPVEPPRVSMYDSTLSRLADVTPQDIATNPGRFQPIGDQKVFMMNPQGEKYSFSASEAQQALAHGWDFLSPARVQTQKEIEFYQQKHGGAGNVAARQFVNQLFMGAPEIIEGHSTPYAEQEAIRRESAKHGVANVAGGVAGFGASLLAGGLIAKGGRAAQAGLEGAAAIDAARTAAAATAEAVAPGLARQALTAAGRGALEGAAYASPQAAAHLAYGDTEHAAEALLWGLGTGGVVGLGSGLYSSAVTGLKGAARAKALELGVLTQEGTVDHGKLRQLLGATESIPNSLQGRTTEELLALRAERAQALGAHSSILDEALGRAPKEMAEKLGVVPAELASKVEQQVLSTRPLITSPERAAELAHLNAAVKEIASHGDRRVGFQDIDRIARMGLSAEEHGAVQEALARPGLSEQQKIAKQVQDVIQSEKSRAMNEAYSALGLNEHYGDYLAQKDALQQIGAALRNNAMQGPGLAGMLSEKVSGGISKGIAGMTGGLIGKSVGGPLGAVVGFKLVKPLADRIVKSAIGGQLEGIAGRALGRIAEDPESFGWLGSAMAKDAMDASESKLFSIGSTLIRGAENLKRDPVKDALGSEANGLSKPQQYDRVVAKVAMAAADPAKLAHETEAVGHAFSKDPELAQAFAQKQQQAVSYLAGAIPKTDTPRPFEKQGREPSRQEKKAFLDKLEVSQNPWAVIDHVRNGTLTKEHVEALDTLYPNLKAQMMAEVARMAHDPESPAVSNGVRQGLSMLSGINLHGVPGLNYQQVYPSSPEPVKLGAPSKREKGGGSSRASLKDTPSLATNSVRLEYKGARIME